MSQQAGDILRTLPYDTSMRFFTRRRLLLAVPLGILLLVAVAVVLAVVSSEDLKTSSARITVGMPRAQVEEVLGPPVLVLRRPAGGGAVLLCWVDQFWQVEVKTGADGRVESTGCIPSDSVYRRTLGRLLALP